MDDQITGRNTKLTAFYLTEIPQTLPPGKFDSANVISIKRF